LDRYKVRAFVIDSREGGRFGGTGKTSDWKLAKAVGRNHPVVLSGGLSPENVEAAIAAVCPRAVDVNSGIEIAPGKKDHQKMRGFMERVHLSSGRAGAGIFGLDENQLGESRIFSERTK
jgi:phosphoribosylanthranilate isomerase